MNLKKYLKRRFLSLTGQASLEYFIIFSVIAGLTLLSFSTFLPKVKNAIQGTETKKGFFQITVEEIIK